MPALKRSEYPYEFSLICVDLCASIIDGLCKIIAQYDIPDSKKRKIQVATKTLLQAKKELEAV